MLLITKARMQALQWVDTAGAPKKYFVTMWEDDDTACEIKHDPNRVKTHLQWLANNTAVAGFFILSCPYISGGACGLGMLGVTLNYLGIAWSFISGSSDDYVGIAVEKSGVSGYYGYGTHVLLLDPTTDQNGGITLVYKPQ